MKYTVIDTLQVTYIIDGDEATEKSIQTDAAKLQESMKSRLAADDVVVLGHKVFIHDEEGIANDSRGNS